MPRVELSHVTKTFGAWPAVDDISVVVEDGTFTTLLGPSGCGKTTTLRMLAGFERPDQGTIAIGSQTVAAGRDSRRFVVPERRNIGVVFQSYALWPHMTAFDQVAYPLKVRRIKKPEIRERVLSALDLVGLADLSAKFPSELSGGQQQRIALARALVFRPAVLLLDEPLSNLDAELRKQMRDELGNLHDTLKITFVYVTHDQSEALALSDQILVMSKGRIIESGAPRQIYHAPSSGYAAKFVGAANHISAKLISVDGESVTARTEQGFDIAGVGHDIGPELIGLNVLVTIRPEEIEVLAAGPVNVANEISGLVTHQTYLGAHSELTVAAGLETLRVHSQVGPEGHPAEIRLRLPPGAVRVFPVERSDAS